jgi:hypothetical protein
LIPHFSVGYISLCYGHAIVNNIRAHTNRSTITQTVDSQKKRNPNNQIKVTATKILRDFIEQTKTAPQSKSKYLGDVQSNFDICGHPRQRHITILN